MENKLAEYISDTNFDDLPKEPVDVIKKAVLTIVGATIDGTTNKGCEAVVNQSKGGVANNQPAMLSFT